MLSVVILSAVMHRGALAKEEELKYKTMMKVAASREILLKEKAQYS